MKLIYLLWRLISSNCFIQSNLQIFGDNFLRNKAFIYKFYFVFLIYFFFMWNHFFWIILQISEYTLMYIYIFFIYIFIYFTSHKVYMEIETLKSQLLKLRLRYKCKSVFVLEFANFVRLFHEFFPWVHETLACVTCSSLLCGFSVSTSVLIVYNKECYEIHRNEPWFFINRCCHSTQIELRNIFSNLHFL